MEEFKAFVQRSFFCTENFPFIPIIVKSNEQKGRGEDMQQDFFFHVPQSYIEILEHARRLISHESNSGEESRIEHQINTRLYNNAFCGLLKTGAPFRLAEDNEKKFLIMEVGGISYQCPASSASNILRNEYEAIITAGQSQYLEKEEESLKRQKIKTGKAPSPFLMKSGLPDMDSFEFSPPKKHKIRDIGEEAGQEMSREPTDNQEKGMADSRNEKLEHPSSKPKGLYRIRQSYLFLKTNGFVNRCPILKA